jgi:hypothetical protein
MDSPASDVIITTITADTHPSDSARAKGATIWRREYHFPKISSSISLIIEESICAPGKS